MTNKPISFLRGLAQFFALFVIFSSPCACHFLLPNGMKGVVAYPEIFFWWVQQIQLMTGGRENGDLWAVVP
jgi:hypothetical protein